MIYADGRQLWRVIGNLYNNTAKYAMPDTRVCAEVAKDGSEATFTMKNISEKLLNVDADKENCDKTLINELETRRKQLDILPYVSFGSAEFSVGDDIDKVKELADRNMYRMKKQHKNAKA